MQSSAWTNLSLPLRSKLLLLIALQIWLMSPSHSASLQSLTCSSHWASNRAVITCFWNSWWFSWQYWKAIFMASWKLLSFGVISRVALVRLYCWSLELSFAPIVVAWPSFAIRWKHWHINSWWSIHLVDCCLGFSRSTFLVHIVARITTVVTVPQKPLPTAPNWQDTPRFLHSYVDKPLIPLPHWMDAAVWGTWFQGASAKGVSLYCQHYSDSERNHLPSHWSEQNTAEKAMIAFVPE